MKILVFSVIQALAASAFAGSYSTVVCNYAQPLPGGATYMLVIENAAPGIGAKAIVLSKASGVAKPQWQLLSGAAAVLQAADGGPTIVSTPRSVIDWSSPSNQQECFVMDETQSFMLKTNESKATITNRVFPVRNPNKSNCPQIMPPNPNPPSQDLVCEVQ